MTVATTTSLPVFEQIAELPPLVKWGGSLFFIAVALLVRYRDTAYGSRKPLPRLTDDPSQRWPKGPKGQLLLGNQPELAGNAHRYLDKFLEWRNEYGLGYEVTLPGYRMIEVNHPVWLEHFQKTAFNKYGKRHLVATNGKLQRTGVFTSDGHNWMVQRKAATHAFSRNHFKGPISQKLAHHIDILVSLLDNLAVTGEVFDFQDVMARFTMLFSMSVSFSTASVIKNSLTSDPDCLKRRYEFIDGFDNASPLIDARTRDSLWRIKEIFNKSIPQQIDATIKAIYDFIEPIVQQRLKEVKPGTKNREGDLLDLFLEQESDPWVLSGWMVNVLFAGRDTTAFSVSWQLYELLKNEKNGGNLIKRAREEIDKQGLSHCAEEHAYLDYDNIKDLRFMNALWQETTRYHPASARGVSICYEDDILPAIPDMNQPAVPVKKGDLVMWQDWVMNRLESVWEKPLEFDPDRFLTPDGSPKPVSLWTWHSFNAGPRTCLGKTLATFDNLSVMSALLPRYDFELADPSYKPSYTTGMNMGLDQGLMIRVKRRDQGL